MERRCGNCKFIEIKPDALGRRIPRKDRCYECSCPIPALPALPDCIVRDVDFRWPPRRNWVTAEMGDDCATFLPK